MIITTISFLHLVGRVPAPPTLESLVLGFQATTYGADKYSFEQHSRMIVKSKGTKDSEVGFPVIKFTGSKNQWIASFILAKKTEHINGVAFGKFFPEQAAEVNPDMSRARLLLLSRSFFLPQLDWLMNPDVTNGGFFEPVARWQNTKIVGKQYVCIGEYDNDRKTKLKCYFDMADLTPSEIVVIDSGGQVEIHSMLKVVH